MNLRAHLTELAGGAVPVGLLLNTCRLEWGGADCYGEEAIAELFGGAPMRFDAADTLVQAAFGVALVGGAQALVADLYDGRIGRLWRLGPGDAPEMEPTVAVAFDPDLRQTRGDVYWRPEDHPELALSRHPAIEQAGRDLLARPDGEPLHRARTFVVRAFGDEEAVALYAVHRLSGGAVRTAGFGYAVAGWSAEGKRWLVQDQRRPVAWTSHL